MRILPVATTTAMVLALAACDQKNNQEQAPPQQSQPAEVEPSTPVPSQPIVSSIQISVTLDCVAQQGAALPPDSLSGILTTMTLATSDGRQIRFESQQTDKVQISAQPNGDYALTLTFVPQNPADVTGKLVSDLETVTTLSIQVQKLLANALHLSLGPQAISAVTVTVNGIAAGHASPIAPATMPDEDTPLVVDISGAVAGIDQAYRSAGGN